MHDINDKFMFVNPLKNTTTKSTRKIYHYTSPEGLKGILDSSSIRFSDVQFLNDKSEYNHISKPLIAAFDKMKGLISFDYDGIVEYIDKEYEIKEMTVISGNGWDTKFETTDMRYYVFCTSKSQDSLGIWNYYVKNGNYQGYNIGFTINQILSCFDLINESKVKVLYGDIIYKEEEQINVLSQLLLDVNNKLDKMYNENKKIQDKEEKYIEDQCAYQGCMGDILSNIESLRLFFKDNAFENEEEFRFVLKIPRDYSAKANKSINTGFAIKNGVFTPYCDLIIDKEKTINTIMIAPIMEGDLARNGVERYLKCNNYNKKINIIQSKIPIRY